MLTVLFFVVLLHTVYAMRLGRTTKKSFWFYFLKPIKDSHKFYKTVREHPLVLAHEQKSLKKRLEKVEKKIIHRKGDK